MRQATSMVICLVLLFQSITGSAANKGFLLFSGKIVSSDKSVGQASLKLLQNNQEVTTFNTKSDGLFSLYLDLNSAYEIRITSPQNKNGSIKLSTILPQGLTETKFELNSEIRLSGIKESVEIIGYVWYSKAERKFVFSSQKAPVTSNRNEQKYEPVKDPKDPDKIFGSNEKSASANYSESEKDKQSQIKNNAAVKTEANATLVKSIVDANKKRKPEPFSIPCNEEKKEQDRYKTTTSVTVCIGTSKCSLRKVEYKWGSMYFYKNGIQITEKEYAEELSKLKPKEK